jgi:transposase
MRGKEQTARELSIIYNVSTTTIYNVVKDFQNKKKIDPLKPGGRKSSISPQKLQVCLSNRASSDYN